MAKTIEPRIVARAYEHREHGRLGQVELGAPGGEWTLNGSTLPETSVMHLMTFALQTLQDAYAGATDTKDAQARFDGKLKRLIDGTLGTRTGGAAVDPVTEAIRSLLRGPVKQAYEAKEGKGTWKTLEEDAIDGMLDAAFAAQPAEKQAAIRAMAEKKVADAKAEREARAALGIAVNL